MSNMSPDVTLLRLRDLGIHFRQAVKIVQSRQHPVLPQACGHAHCWIDTVCNGVFCFSNVLRYWDLVWTLLYVAMHHDKQLVWFKAQVAPLRKTCEIAYGGKYPFALNYVSGCPCCTCRSSASSSGRQWRLCNPANIPFYHRCGTLLNLIDLVLRVVGYFVLLTSWDIGTCG